MRIATPNIVKLYAPERNPIQVVRSFDLQLTTYFDWTQQWSYTVPINRVLILQTAWTRLLYPGTVSAIYGGGVRVDVSTRVVLRLQTSAVYEGLFMNSEWALNGYILPPTNIAGYAMASGPSGLLANAGMIGIEHDM
jgi:hypothetical protein